MTADEAQIIFWIIIAVLLGTVTAKIASDRGVPGSPLSWFIAGTFLLIVALPLAIFMKPKPKRVEKDDLDSGNSKKCPQCAEIVKSEAIRCRFCGHDFSATRQAVEGTKKCTGCGSWVLKDAVRCRHCGHRFSPRPSIVARR